MPRKIDDSRSYGQKLIRLFALLLFTGNERSLGDLANELGCTKQSVLRLVDDIQMAYNLDIEVTKRQKQSYYRLKKNGRNLPSLPVTESELTSLYLCQAFASHLLGDHFLDETHQALLKSRTTLPKECTFDSKYFDSISKGTIDYSAQQQNLTKIIEALETHRQCKVTYRAWNREAKTYHIMPLKLFAYQNTLYLHAKKMKRGHRSPEENYDPLLAIHRFVSVEVSDWPFTYPDDYDFNKVFKQSFGLMQDECFRLQIKFSAWAATYVAERTWSHDQTILSHDNDELVIEVSASSIPEVVSWILSFGEHAQVLEPDWLIDEVKASLTRTIANYDACPN